MKTYSQLTDAEKATALERATCDLLEAIVSGSVRFNDSLNGDDLQKRIDDACAKAEAMQTPWFAHEYVMDTCADDIRGMATCDAEDAHYPEPGERAIYIPMEQAS